MIFKTITYAVPAVFTAAAAFAIPATPEGAQQMTEVLQAYFGATDGVVLVSPAGEAYSLTIDAAPLLALAPAELAGTTMSPMVMQVTDNGDGTWAVTQDQAFAFAMTLPGIADISLDIARMWGTGVFDQELKAYVSSHSEFTGMAITEQLTQPGQPPMDVTISLASGLIDATAQANPAGGLDSTSTMTMTGLAQTISMPPMGEGMPPVDVSITAQSYVTTGNVTGFRIGGLLDLMQWAIAHPTAEAAEADKAGLKVLVQAVLPVFDTLAGAGTITNVSVTTPFGAVGIAEVVTEIEAHGVTSDGLFREAITLSGLTLPDGLLPPWAVPLLPTDFSIDVAVSGYDLAAPAMLLLPLFDLPTGTGPDQAMQDQALAALLPDGAVEITLAPGSVTGNGYELTYQGAMTAGPAAMPTGSATVTLTGAGAISAALAAAPAEVKGQALPGFAMAQGMAKPDENGALVWEIDATRPGTLMINGMDMMGGQ